MTPDIQGAVLVLFAGIIICQSAYVFTLRDDRRRARREARIFRRHNQLLRDALARAESHSNVLQMFPNGLDERPGRETFPDTFGGAS